MLLLQGYSDIFNICAATIITTTAITATTITTSTTTTCMSVIDLFCIVSYFSGIHGDVSFCLFEIAAYSYSLLCSFPLND